MDRSRPYRCDACGMRFEEEILAKDHLSEVHLEYDPL